MIYLYTAVLGGYALLWILSRREEGRDPFHKMAAYLVRNRERMLHRTAETIICQDIAPCWWCCLSACLSAS